MNLIRKKVRQLLKTLPSSPKEIAKFFLENNHFGRLSNSLSCPVSHYVFKNTGHYTCTGTNYTVLLMDEGCPYVSLPEGVKKFVRKFDDGHYPELIRRRKNNAVE